MLVGEFNQIGKVGCLIWFAGHLIYSDRYKMYACYLDWIAGSLIY